MTLRRDRFADLPCRAVSRKSANDSQLWEAVMIVLTVGPASLARLMRRERYSQHLAPGQMDSHQDQGDQAETGAETEGRVHPPGL